MLQKSHQYLHSISLLIDVSQKFAVGLLYKISKKPLSEVICVNITRLSQCLHMCTHARTVTHIHSSLHHKMLCVDVYDNVLTTFGSDCCCQVK